MEGGWSGVVVAGGAASCCGAYGVKAANMQELERNIPKIELIICCVLVAASNILHACNRCFPTACTAPLTDG